MEKYVSNITNQHQALTLVEENTIKSRNLQLRWCQQEGRIGSLLLTCPLCNCNLVVIHKQKWICGSFGIQEEDCETPVGSKTKEAHFDMAGYAQLAVSLTIFPFIKPKKSSYPCGLSYGSIWPWSCHEHHMSMDLGRSMPQVTDLQTLTLKLACDQLQSLLTSAWEFLKARLWNSVWQCILKWPCNWITAPFNCSLWTVLLAKRPGRKHASLHHRHPEIDLYLVPTPLNSNL